MYPYFVSFSTAGDLLTEAKWGRWLFPLHHHLSSQAKFHYECSICCWQDQHDSQQTRSVSLLS